VGRVVVVEQHNSMRPRDRRCHPATVAGLVWFVTTCSKHAVSGVDDVAHDGSLQPEEIGPASSAPVLMVTLADVALPRREQLVGMTHVLGRHVKVLGMNEPPWQLRPATVRSRLRPQVGTQIPANNVPSPHDVEPSTVGRVQYGPQWKGGDPGATGGPPATHQRAVCS
jgi:hypothetical protein